MSRLVIYFVVTSLSVFSAFANADERPDKIRCLEEDTQHECLKIACSSKNPDKDLRDYMCLKAGEEWIPNRSIICESTSQSLRQKGYDVQCRASDIL